MATLVAVPAAGVAAESAPAPESSWIVVLDHKLRPEAHGVTLARSVGAEPTATFSRVVNGFAFRGSEAAADALRRNPNVRAVVPDGEVTLADIVPPGIERIDALEAHQPANGAHTGAGVRIVVIDTGVDLNHPDLIDNIEPDTSKHANCQNPGASADDDQGHGTHVAGSAAAVANTIGRVGVAPGATIIPVKAFNAAGTANVSHILCSLDHVASLVADGIPIVVNASYGEPGPDSECDDADVSDLMHEAVCDLADMGVIQVAAAGNSAANTSGSQPANFAETIAVSAMTDLDGIPGGLGGCEFDISTLMNHCDDTFAGFSNWGADVDVAAPGSLINSTRMGGGYEDKSGTSMATPHVAGVAALMLAVDPTLDIHAMRQLMLQSGECSDGSVNGNSGPCAAAVWPGDPDGIAEPLVNALRSAQKAGEVRWVEPDDGELVSGMIPLAVRVPGESPAGSSTVEWRADGGAYSPLSYNAATGHYEGTWDATSAADGTYSLETRATNVAGTETATIEVVISAYAEAVLADDAKVYWRLNETNGSASVDMINFLAAAHVGTPTLGATSLLGPDPDPATGFDGVGAMLAPPNANRINTGGPYAEKTVELWFNANDVTSRQVLFEAGGKSRGTSIYIDQGSVYLGAWNTINDGANAPWDPVFVSAPIATGVTYHVAVVLDQPAGELRGYVNGSLVDTATGVGKLYAHSAKVGIAGMNDDVRFHDGHFTDPGTGFYFDGTIDEVAIYGTALSGAAISNHTTIGAAIMGDPPTVEIIEPGEGAALSGSAPLSIDATDADDPAGSLTVEWRVDGGAWTVAPYDGGAGMYESVIDTTTLSNDGHVIEARAIDSTFATDSDTVSVTVDNSSPYESAVLGDGAVALWRLGEFSGTTAFDAAGAHDAPYAGSPGLGALGLLDGDSSAAVDFDGVDDIVRVPNAADINTGGPYTARTVEMWFNADDVTTRQVLFEEGGATRGLAIYVDQGELYFIGWNKKNDDVTTPWGADWVTAPVQTATTYHIALVLDQPSGELTGYVNGTAVGLAPGIGKLFKHGAKVGLGGMDDDVRFHDGVVNNSGTAYHFNGRIDEVAIYNTALSAVTVANHTAIGGGSVAVAPTVAIIAPADGAELSDLAPIEINASDDADATATLTVEWRVDGGTWSTATYNGATGTFDSSWDTTTASDGAHTVEARAVDSDGAIGTDQVNVTVTNASAYAAAVAADGAIAHWRLAEGSGTAATDEVGSHSATYAGSPSLGASSLLPADSNPAVGFDGVNDLVAVANAGDINSGGPYAARTIELWFQATDVSNRQVLFEEGGISRGLAVYIDQGEIYFIGWNNKNDDATTPWGPVWVSTSVAAGTTYHVVMVHDAASGTIEGYVNGTSAGSVGGVGNLFKHSAKVAIGAMSDDVKFHDGPVTNSGKAYFFAGTIDEVALYNTALTGTQVANHYTLAGGA